MTVVTITSEINKLMFYADVFQIIIILLYIFPSTILTFVIVFIEIKYIK